MVGIYTYMKNLKKTICQIGIAAKFCFSLYVNGLVCFVIALLVNNCNIKKFCFSMKWLS